MAHFTRVRPSGFWTSNSTLLSTECEAFDSRIYAAVNGDGGGVWAPAAVIEIGGSGLKTTGAFVATGGITANTVSVSNTLTVQGVTTLQDAVNITGDITGNNDLFIERIGVHGAMVGGNLLSVHGDATITGDGNIDGGLGVGGALSVVGTVSVESTSLFQDDVTVDTRLAIGGAQEVGVYLKAYGPVKFTTSATVGGNLTVSGSTSLVGLTTSASAAFGAGITVTTDVSAGGDIAATGDIDAGGTITGIGRIKRRPYTFPSDADATVNITTGDVFYMPNGLMTAARTITLSTASATTGDQVTFCTLDATTTLFVGGYGLKFASGASQFATFTFISGGWVLTSYGIH